MSLSPEDKYTHAIDGQPEGCPVETLACIWVISCQLSGASMDNVKSGDVQLRLTFQ